MNFKTYKKPPPPLQRICFFLELINANWYPDILGESPPPLGLTHCDITKNDTFRAVQPEGGGGVEVTISTGLGGIFVNRAEGFHLTC